VRICSEAGLIGHILKEGGADSSDIVSYTDFTWVDYKKQAAKKIRRRWSRDTSASGARSFEVGIAYLPKDFSSTRFLIYGFCTVNILYNRGVAFVTYSNEAQAQFAKEAMSNQSLDGEEILNVRSVAIYIVRDLSGAFAYTLPLFQPDGQLKILTPFKKYLRSEGLKNSAKRLFKERSMRT
jgi:RNA recognition motif-containing protein